MTTINQPFEIHAVTDGLIGYPVLATPSKPVNAHSQMCISDGTVVYYITKQQAMDFFGLKDPMAVRHNLD